MKTLPDIYRISIPFVLGTGMAAMLCRWLPAAPVHHLIAGMSAAILAAAAIVPSAFPDDAGNPCRSSAYWFFAFLVAGILCREGAETVYASMAGGGHFTGISVAIAGAIDTIPFAQREDNALAKALILGDRNSLTPSTINDFRAAGAAHILALSGMHLGIIYVAMERTLRLVGNRPAQQKTRSIAIITLTGCYTILCGAGASLLRAWLFIFLNETAKILEKPQPPQHIFCTALTLHLVFRPSDISSPGFQLSYLAMVGIVFLWPHIKDWMDSAVWKGASLSISCQIFTAPLTMIYFGTFPKYFLITNLVASPLVPVVMGAGITATAANAYGIGWPLLYYACELPSRVFRWLLGVIACM